MRPVLFLVASIVLVQLPQLLERERLDLLVLVLFLNLVHEVYTVFICQNMEERRPLRAHREPQRPDHFDQLLHWPVVVDDDDDRVQLLVDCVVHPVERASGKVADVAVKIFGFFITIS